jgi:type IX secretion system PorP/SprF family membrane protein
MRKGVVLVFIVLFAIVANAQQIGMYSHYFYNPMLYNPAFTGSTDATNAMLINHTQWTDFKGAPKLTAFTLDGSLVEKKAGLGLTLVNESKGITNQTGGYISYSYRIKINEEAHLMFGLSLGVINQSLDFSKAQVENNTDPTMFGDLQHKTTFDGNAGLALVWKGLEFGAAVPQIFDNKINYVDNTNVRIYYTQTRHYMSSLKYKFFISKEKGISIAPQALVRFVPNAPFQYDGNLNLDWKDKFWVGATYKSNYAVAANVGFCIHKQLYIGYSYDFIIGNIGTYSGMSQEIMIHFKFGSAKKTEAPVAVIAEDKNQVLENAKYEEQMDGLQTAINESNKKIKELEDKLAKESKKENTLAPKLGLNDLIYQQLMFKIEAMFDNPNATPPEVQELRNEISSFLDSDFGDAAEQKNLKKKYEQLNRSQDATSVLVKGVIVLQKGDLPPGSYSTVSITVTDKETNQLVGTYKPNALSGKYLFILTPGKNYVIKAENAGYQTHEEDFSPTDGKETYEMSQEIRLKVAD